MLKTIGIIALGLLLSTFPAYAIETPALVSPANNSTITSTPTFTWQAVTGATGYNILIDDEPTVTSPYAKTPYYPTNPSYSPQTLNPGTYYWKVKAKDSSGQYGNFSSIWTFTLQSQTSSPSPTPTPAPTPSPTPSSTSSISTSSSFTISNAPSQINSDQSFSVSVNLSLPNNPNTQFYLKGAFKKTDSSNYFGLTKVSGSWVKNGSSYPEQYQITTDGAGNWSGNLEVQVDSEDSGFTGGGDYILKVARYTSTGSGPTWSNESSIKIIALETSEQGGTSADTSSTTSNPSTSPSVAPTSKSIISTKSKISTRSIPNTASVSAATASATLSAIPSSEKLVKSQKQINFPLIIGILLIVSGIGLSSYIYLQNHEKIFNKLRKRN